MKIAYFDCFAGAGGDMIVGALIDAGADADALGAELAKLHAEFYIRCEPVRRGGIAGVRFYVDAKPGEKPNRHLADVCEMIDSAGVPGPAAERAKEIFTRLAQAEAKVHQVEIDEVHFHEVGAVDSIADIVGACVALQLLRIERVLCSPIAVGSGTVRCDHGEFPVPAPATAELLVGVPTAKGAPEGEATTPTGAAVLTTLAESYGPLPPMTVQAVGYGAGACEGGDVPNLLRVFVGEFSSDGTADSVVEVSANIDDCSGEVIGATIEKLLSAGCVDAWAMPIFMKKSRPAWVLSALCEPRDLPEAERIIFTETTTFGVRRRVCTRRKLDRSWETVETRYGPIRMKLGRLDERIVTASPEFADCLAAAEAHHVPARTVIHEAEATFRQAKGTQ